MGGPYLWWLCCFGWRSDVDVGEISSPRSCVVLLDNVGGSWFFGLSHSLLSNFHLLFLVNRGGHFGYVLTQSELLWRET